MAQPGGDPSKGKRRKRRSDRRDGDVVDTAIDAAELGGDVVGGARAVSHAGRRGCGGCDACDGPDCGCDLLLFLRLSTVLALVAVLVPPVGGDALVAAALRGYRRWLTRFTPRCPGTPSCSAYALAAVHRLGARRGLTAAAHRIAACPHPPPAR